MNVLSEIIARKRDRVREAKSSVRPHALRRALQADGINIIAEFKRRSPSKGVIRGDADLPWLVERYEAGGAVANAVLLIVAALEDQQLESLRRLAEDELKMDALVEVHNVEEMGRAAGCGAKL